MVTPPPMQCMITIDYCDGNRFLARQPRQSGPPSKTLPGATFTQQPKGAMQRKRASSRDICATQGRNTEAVGPRSSVDSPAHGLAGDRLRLLTRAQLRKESAIGSWSYATGSGLALWLPHPARSERRVQHPRHFRLAAHVSPVGNRSDTCETSRGTPLSGRMRLAIGRPRDPVAAISYENLPLKVGPILPLANRVGGCGDRLSLNFGSALPRGR